MGTLSLWLLLFGSSYWKAGFGCCCLAVALEGWLIIVFAVGIGSLALAVVVWYLFVVIGRLALVVAVLFFVVFAVGIGVFGRLALAVVVW